jgi:Cu/Ag efflux protein CusF
MKRLFATFAVLGVVVLLAAPALAQTKTLTGETITKTATVEAINYGTRELTIKGPDGKYVTFIASAEVKRFDALKVGDTITAKYYENLVIRVKLPGEKDVDSATAGAAPSAGAKPGATVAEQRTITATITEIDPKVPSITFKGPNNWTYSSRVEDRKALAKVKVGDKVDLTWTQAVLIGIETAPAKK